MEKVNEFLEKIKRFLIDNNKEGFKKYINLIILSAVLLVIVVILIIAIPDKKDTTMILNPNDTNQTEDEIPFEDNKAVAVTPTTQNALSNKRSTPPLESPFSKQQKTTSSKSSDLQTNGIEETTKNNDTNNDEVNENYPSENIQNSTQDVSSKQVYLLCDVFRTENMAAERKANIAFSTGYISKVVYEDNAYRVLVGPFQNRNEAVKAFNKMDDAALADECKIK